MMLIGLDLAETRAQADESASDGCYYYSYCFTTLMPPCEMRVLENRRFKGQTTQRNSRSGVIFTKKQM